ncbi:MAG: NADH-quinone oxidoreductase subunit C [bacterium]
MLIQQIIQAVGDRYPGTLVSVDQGGQIPTLLLNPKWLVRVLFVLRDEFDFESLMCETASDKGERIMMIYHLFSTKHRQKLVVKTELLKEDLRMETAEEVWRAANWYEREIFDLFGVEFVGHSDLVRIMLPPDWVGHPLLKDYAPAPEYQGMKIEW